MTPEPWLERAALVREQGMEALAHWDIRDRLDQIEAPTRILAGGEDPSTPPAHAYALGAAIPNARVTVLEHAMHLASRNIRSASRSCWSSTSSPRRLRSTPEVRIENARVRASGHGAAFSATRTSIAHRVNP